MTPQRMLHAIARGARVEYLYEGATEWSQVVPHVDDLNDRDYRLKPADVHLQYGPVATAFRDMALYELDGEIDPVVEMFLDFAGQNSVLQPTGDDAITFEQYNLLADFCRLFYAEMLADEGL